MHLTPWDERLDTYTREVLQVLGLPDSAPELFRRVRGFIRCNGYAGVRAAAEETAETARRSSVKEPWGHARSVFNQGMARGNVLHGLLHLAETGLRSWVDLRLHASRGATWHHTVGGLLDPNGRQQLNTDLDRITINDPHGGRRKAIPSDYATPAEFLEAVSFGTLRAIIRSTYTKTYGPVLVRPGDGRDVPASELHADLDSINEARNAVAHCRIVTRAAFEQVAKKLGALLELLQFDVPRTIYRTERARHAATQRIPFLAGPVLNAAAAAYQRQQQHGKATASVAVTEGGGPQHHTGQ